jgi:hypothetical protein
MNSQINSLLVTGFIEDQIRAAAESRLLPEYQREARVARARRATGPRWARALWRTAHV